MPRTRVQPTTAIRLVIDQQLRDKIERARNNRAIVQWAIEALTAAVAAPDSLMLPVRKPKTPVSLFLELPPALVASINGEVERMGWIRSEFMRSALEAYAER